MWVGPSSGSMDLGLESGYFHSQAGKVTQPERLRTSDTRSQAIVLGCMTLSWVYYLDTDDCFLSADYELSRLLIDEIILQAKNSIRYGSDQ